MVAVILATGTFYTIQGPMQKEAAQAYTSPINTQDPATAPDSYVINFPDINLKRALNPVIAAAMNEQRRRQGLPQNVVRTADQEITAGDMKVPVNMYGPLGLNSKNITNIEGLQFLVNVARLDIINNTAKANARVLLGDTNASQAQIDNANQQLAAAIAALTTDKQPVQNIINSTGTQPQYVQDDPAVKQALLAAKAVNDAANPSVEEVRAKADALANAIGRAQINARKVQPRASEGEHKKPHVSSTRLSDTGESTTLIAVIGTVATFGGGALLLARQRRQGDH